MNSKNVFHTMNKLAIFAGLMAALILLGVLPATTWAGNETTWPLLHADTRNSDSIPFAGPTGLVARWHALDGKSLAAGAIVGPEGNIYTVSMDGGSALHAIDKDGGVLWSSDLVAASYASPVVGDNGEIYVISGNYNDSAQLMRFEKDGTIAWSTSLANPGLAPMIMPDGNILTMDINCEFRVYDANGAMVLDQPFQLPAAVNPVVPMNPYIGMGLATIGIDPAFVQYFWDSWKTSNMVTGNNVPAIHPETGRIFIPCLSPDGATGQIYALDYTPPDNTSPGSITLAPEFGLMDSGSNTSPAISENLNHIYAGDVAGDLYAFNTSDLSLAWKLSLPSVSGDALASPTVGSNGRIYFNKSGKLFAIQDNGSSAEIIWEKYVDELSDPEIGLVGKIASVMPLSQNALYAAVTVGVSVGVTDLPVLNYLVTFDPETGNAISFVMLGEESNAAPSIGSNGWIYVPCKPLRRGLLEGLRMIPGNPYNLPPFYTPQHAGLYAFEPASYAQMAPDGLLTANDLTGDALQALNQSKVKEAEGLTAIGLRQLQMVLLNLEKARQKLEIRIGTFICTSEHVMRAKLNLELAYEFIKKGKLEQAIRKVQDAEGFILEASDVFNNRVIPEPPKQPLRGPGGSDYTYPGDPIVSGVPGVGGYTIYEPNPRPLNPAPVVVFLHGNIPLEQFSDVDDIEDVAGSGDLMAHLAKKGNIVIYPRYQSSSRTPDPTLQTQTVLDSISAALADLKGNTESSEPDEENFGLIGHSRGGWLAINAAALCEPSGLPEPDYVLAYEPGEDTHSGIPQTDWTGLPADMKLLVVIGEDDDFAGEYAYRYGGKKIWEGTTGIIPDEQRNFIKVQSDYRGFPALKADHSIPVTTNPPLNNAVLDAMDYYAVWKLADALIGCTGNGSFCDYCLGNTWKQRYMGLWSDGRPVKPLIVTADAP